MVVMQESGIINNWNKRHFGARTQAQVISYLLNQVDYFIE
jgi:hypothetical protein